MKKIWFSVKWSVLTAILFVMNVFFWELIPFSDGVSLTFAFGTSLALLLTMGERVDMKRRLLFGCEQGENSWLSWF